MTVAEPSATIRPAGGPTLTGAFSSGPLVVWGAVILNLLPFTSLPTLFPIPASIGQLITQGSLAVALMLALLANPRGVVRPSLVLVLLTCVSVVALMVAPHNEFLFGSSFRACRLFVFVLVLWLLTPWWGRADMVLLRAHLICLRVILVSVLLGVLFAPGAAFSYDGRLSGALWPIPPTQVAHYAAVLLGCTVLLWFCGAMGGRTTLLTLLGSTAVLIETHTRTALVALVAGMIISAASLFVGYARVRRASARFGFVAVLAATFLGPVLVKWALRGQTAEEAGQLTGRTKVWSEVFQLPRAPLEQLFGSGLTNGSFNGLPIDSNWVATYFDQGWFGLSIEVMCLLVIVLLAITHPPGAQRAVALFLVAYCLVASFTETGLGSAATYTLEMVLAASLVAIPVRAPLTP